jgi:hypothetical protein
VPELSICQLAMLTAIFTADEHVLDTDQLLERVPYSEPSLGATDVSAWFDELQALFDRELVLREAAPHGYVYRATTQAAAIVYGYTARALMPRIA